MAIQYDNSINQISVDNTNSGNITIKAINQLGDGGSIYCIAGDSGGFPGFNGGSIQFLTGNASVGASAGGNFQIQTGSGAVPGSSGAGGSILMNTGTSGTLSVGGNYQSFLGDGEAQGGGFYWQSGNGTVNGPGGSYTIVLGNGFDTGNGGDFSVDCGDADTDARGGLMTFTAGNGGSNSGVGGGITFTTGNSTSPGAYDGGDFLFVTGNSAGTGRSGHFLFNPSSGGFMGINTFPSVMFEVANNVDDFVSKIYNNNGTTSASGLEIRAGDATSGTLINFQRSLGVGVGSITHNGTNTAYNTVSDARLKDNIRDTHFNLNDLMKVKVRDFEWNTNNKTSTGFIAQELKEVYPEAVHEPQNKEVFMQVDYGKITPLLVQAIQDQQKVIQKLEKRIVDLERNKNGE